MAAIHTFISILSMVTCTHSCLIVVGKICTLLIITCQALGLLTSVDISNKTSYTCAYYTLCGMLFMGYSSHYIYKNRQNSQKHTGIVRESM